VADITSRPYRPEPGGCCEACCFGGGEHAEWCSRVMVLCPRCTSELHFDKRNLSWTVAACGICGAEFRLVCPDPITIELAGWVDVLRSCGIES
jgi:hypothetical protein